MFVCHNCIIVLMLISQMFNKQNPIIRSLFSQTNLKSRNTDPSLAGARATSKDAVVYSVGLESSNFSQFKQMSTMSYYSSIPVSEPNSN